MRSLRLSKYLAYSELCKGPSSRNIVLMTITADFICAKCNEQQQMLKWPKRDPARRNTMRKSISNVQSTSLCPRGHHTPINIQDSHLDSSLLVVFSVFDQSYRSQQASRGELEATKSFAWAYSNIHGVFGCLLRSDKLFLCSIINWASCQLLIPILNFLWSLKILPQRHLRIYLIDGWPEKATIQPEDLHAPAVISLLKRGSLLVFWPIFDNEAALSESSVSVIPLRAAARPKAYRLYINDFKIMESLQMFVLLTISATVCAYSCALQTQKPSA